MIETCPSHGGQRFRFQPLQAWWRCPISMCGFRITDEWKAGWGWLW